MNEFDIYVSPYSSSKVNDHEECFAYLPDLKTPTALYIENPTTYDIEMPVLSRRMSYYIMSRHDKLQCYDDRRYTFESCPFRRRRDGWHPNSD